MSGHLPTKHTNPVQIDAIPGFGGQLFGLLTDKRRDTFRLQNVTLFCGYRPIVEFEDFFVNVVYVRTDHFSGHVFRLFLFQIIDRKNVKKESNN